MQKISSCARYAALNDMALNFNFDDMLDGKGNNICYLISTHGTLCTVINTAGSDDIEALKKTGGIKLVHPDERAIGRELLQFEEVVEKACLLPNKLCMYTYSMSQKVSSFLTNCPEK
ncbi:Arginine--tRNA ligase, cytoplasmic [Thalictrum thalictroides]|uniref:arginine--tRNA ligase n=1 Tax=Thalictrum thalictroides TaxID=46969 RepID=A0A7J6V924_THATH|nr:Arginine--tRNA ligase, cytoplasmic [Thalictrum thalictroides]